MATQQSDQLYHLLEQAGKIDEDKLVLAKKMADESGAPLRKTLVDIGEIADEDILKTLGENLGMKTIDLSEYRFDPKLLALLPKELAAKHRLIPVEFNESTQTLSVAVADPFDVQSIDTLRFYLEEEGYKLEPMIGREDEVDSAIAKYYTSTDAEVERILQDLNQEMQAEAMEIELDADADEDMDLGELMETIADTDMEDDEAEMVRLVNLILKEGIKSRSSDIHFEPFEKQFTIRFRIDGVLQEVIQSPPKHLQDKILSRLKIMSGLDLAEKRIPQDGRIRMKMSEKDIDFRVSSLPGLFGESIVLRILDKSSTMLGLEEVGFLPENVELFRKLITKPNGIILITGPTGSGKTTTLYSALNTINNVDTKIITIENPVEYQIEGINQVQINEQIGLTFAAGLRSILRQSPNVILVGEIRDAETSEIAIRSALTGHLVFSTLHTNDAPSSPTRLVEMGVKPFLVASAVQAIMAQRLVRVICKECKESYVPDSIILQDFSEDPAQYQGVQFYRGRGCEACSYSGYRGRTAIHEIMVVSEEIQDLIQSRAPTDKVAHLARQQGMRTLREDGFQKALNGVTTLLEVARMTAGDVA